MKLIENTMSNEDLLKLKKAALKRSAKKLSKITLPKNKVPKDYKSSNDVLLEIRYGTR